MAVDPTKFILWSQTVAGRVVSCEEGVKPSERGRDMSATLSRSGSDTGEIHRLNGLVPGDGLLLAGVYVLGVYGFGPVSQVRATIMVGGTPRAHSDPITLGVLGAKQIEIILPSTYDVSATSWYVYLGKISGSGGTVYPVHDDSFFAVKSGSTGAARNTPVITIVSPAAGTHASPTPITSRPRLVVTADNIYPDDAVIVTKYTDTAAGSAHSPSLPVEQEAGTAESLTKTLSGASQRTIEVLAAGNPDVGNGNTYYTLLAENDAGALGLVAWELLMDVRPPTLTTCNGPDALHPATVTDVSPVARWTDPNADTTHWRVRTYRASDDVEVDDSGERIATIDEYAIPHAALDSLEAYYAVVTLMRGPGGSEWQTSNTGYFTPDWTATTVKIISHAGTPDSREVITTQAPTIEWSWPKTQAAYSVSVWDDDTGTLLYSSGWTASAVMSHALPVGTLSLGGSYSVQVQVRDAVQDYTYSCDERAFLHVNEATIPAPTLTSEADQLTTDDVVLEWDAPAVGDGDELTYELEITFPDGSIHAYSGLTGTNFRCGHLPAA